MREFTFSITITADAWTEYYRRPGATVVATTATGRTVSFAAKHLQRHITHTGVHGVFALTVDDDDNFVRLEKRDGIIA